MNGFPFAPGVFSTGATTFRLTTPFFGTATTVQLEYAPPPVAFVGSPDGRALAALPLQAVPVV